MPYTTVREALVFSASMRLPSHREQRISVAEALLDSVSDLR